MRKREREKMLKDLEGVEKLAEEQKIKESRRRESKLVKEDLDRFWGKSRYLKVP